MSDAARDASILNQFIRRAKSLYSLPAVAMEVLRLANAPQVDLKALKECIENDPGLASRVLRVVNSSFFGLTRQVGDLGQALGMLGASPLKLLVLGFSLPRSLSTGIAPTVLERYWRQTLVRAVSSREISKKLWRHSGDDAFLAGLLRGVGTLVLVQELGETYLRFLQRAWENHSDIADEELAHLGFDHSILSSRLLEHWGLPEPIVRAVGQPFDASMLLSLPFDEQPLPQAVHLGELVSRLLEDQRPELLAELLRTGEQYRRLTLPQVEVLVCDLQEKVSHLAEVLSLEIGADDNYQEILARAQSQMAEISEHAIAAGAGVPAETNASGASVNKLAPVGQAPACPWEQLLGDARDLSRGVRPAASSSTTAAATPATPRALSPAGNVAAASSPSPAWAPSSMAGALSSSPVAGDPGLLGRVSAALLGCRQSRTPLSLVMVEVSGLSDLILAQGLERAARLVKAVEQAGSSQGRVCLPVADGRFAVLLPENDRAEAVAWARKIVEGGVAWGLAQTPPAPASLSAGVATVPAAPPNFPPQDLVAAAARCLAAASTAGGGNVKSIEIF